MLIFVKKISVKKKAADKVFHSVQFTGDVRLNQGLRNLIDTTRKSFLILKMDS